MHLVGLAGPEYHRTSGSVRLTLTALSRLSPEQQAALPSGAEAILAVLRRSDHPLGTGDIADTTGRSFGRTVHG
ncbi:hypothetical protein [Brachybacterium vulturis]|uniref:hypothetical protein n=1 Tax=Brachybacterium vulturis TaxID=2017484 RepID=UPI003735B7A1